MVTVYTHTGSGAVVLSTPVYALVRDNAASTPPSLKPVSHTATIKSGDCRKTALLFRDVS